jgi:hypothetical protein
VLTADSVNKATRRYWVTVYIGIVPLIVLLGLNGRIARWLAESLSSYGMQLKWQTLSLAIMVVTLALMFCTIFLTQSRTLPKCSKIVRSPRDVGARLLRFSARYH